MTTTADLGSLLSRASVASVQEPGPDDADVRAILAAAVRAPDHGRLRPWRFYVIRGDARKRLSELFIRALTRREPQVTEEQIEKERQNPLRPPLIIALVAAVQLGHKIPEIEQVLSTAAAGMNILNAAHALGFGAKWVTGANVYDADFRRDFGLAETDRLLGFIRIGSAQQIPEVPRPDPAQFTIEWSGPAD